MEGAFSEVAIQVSAFTRVSGRGGTLRSRSGAGSRPPHVGGVHEYSSYRMRRKERTATHRSPPTLGSYAMRRTLIVPTESRCTSKGWGPSVAVIGVRRGAAYRDNGVRLSLPARPRRDVPRSSSVSGSPKFALCQAGNAPAPPLALIHPSVERGVPGSWRHEVPGGRITDRATYPSRNARGGAAAPRCPCSRRALPTGPPKTGPRRPRRTQRDDP